MNPRIPALAIAFISLAAAPAVLADVTVQLSDVHLCCNSCVKGVDKAVATVPGATAKVDKDAETVAITAADKATAQKAVDAMLAAGYFGKANDASIKTDVASGATDAKVHSLTVSGVHLCCNKCVKAVNEAVKKVPGVTATTAAKDAEKFDVTGDFKPTDVFNALRDAGLSGKQAKAE